MEPPEGFEHVDPDFWARVEPDPDSDCLIFQSSSATPSFKSHTLLVTLLGPAGGKQRYRKCFRSKCVNPDHVVEGKHIPATPRARRVGRGRAGRERFERWYSQC